MIMLTENTCHHHRGLRKTVIGLGTLAALTLAPGCSGSTGTKPPNTGSCSWPKGSIAGFALALGRESGSVTKAHPVQHDRLLAFDATTGRAVGDCALEPGQQPQPAVLEAGEEGAYGPTSFSTNAPPLAADRPRLAPDNAYRGATMHGAVRDLASGRVTSLRFTGWRVVATSMTRLLLTRDTGVSNPYDTAPTAWCVLPSARSARPRCSPVPGASSPGTGGIAPNGAIHWTPVAGTTLTVQGADFLAGRATDGTTTVGSVGPAGSRRQLPTGLDQHSVVFLPGVAGPGPRNDLRWVSYPAAAPSAATLHVTSDDGDAVDRASDPPFAATVVDRGTHLITISRTGRVVEYAAGGPVRRLASLRLPPGVVDISGLSWPAINTGTST